jgi:hypothetical protein
VGSNSNDLISTFGWNCQPEVRLKRYGDPIIKTTELERRNHGGIINWTGKGSAIYIVYLKIITAHMNKIKFLKKEKRLSIYI